MDSSIVLKRMRASYPQIFPVDKITYEQFKSYQGLVSEDPCDFCLFFNSESIKSILFSILSKYQRFNSFEFMPAYRLVDIFLGKDEVYPSILSIEPQLLVLYLGISGTENRRQEDFIIQIWEEQRVNNRHVWLFYKGIESQMSQKYPVLSSRLKELNVSFIKVNNKVCSKVEEEL